MVERAAEDYAKILQSINLEREINPICINIEDMLARLDEFETLLSSVRAENNDIIENHVAGILAFSDHFQILRERVDKLEQFVDMVNTNVNEVEKSIDIAEKELSVTDYSLKGLLIKPLLAKAKSTAAATESAEQPLQSNLKEGEFQPVPIFQTSLHFGEGHISYSEEAKEIKETTSTLVTKIVSVNISKVTVKDTRRCANSLY
ncbi:biogenesis of lysosome-related organelles complex 1 subunit 4 isoform X2 [Rhagoletis pomonella]|uniref:biogenesis of lysosome-related organelles complex 1 subunit 4 isoform X2 n=1 Tax=Rhagoletis pomonella TaxID=28610 RepID=UPI00177C321C|nr:biogenesis of lysosome-related organelles complex 1 subunit 4 isoform X2 [Rhagoletis pomonella]